MNLFRYISHMAVIGALVFSSVGLTTISLSCPMGKQKEAGCPKCQHTTVVPIKKNACCKETITRTVLKTEFEKLDETRLPLVTHLTLSFPLEASLYSEVFLTSPTRLDFYCMALSSPPTVDKCALLSTFQI